MCDMEGSGKEVVGEVGDTGDEIEAEGIGRLATGGLTTG